MKVPLLPRLNSLKLKHKFVLAILVNIFLVLACFALVIHNFQEKKLFQNAEEKNLSLTRSMAGDATEGLLLRDFQQLDVIVNSAQEAIWARYALILDAGGTIVAHTDKGRLGDRLEPPEAEGLTINEFERRGQVLKEYWLPVKVRDELLGFGVLGIDHSKEMSLVRADLGDLRTRLILVSSLLFVVAVLTSSLLAGVLTRRLGLLKGRMLEVQQNNLQVELPEPPQVVCSDFLNCQHTQCPAHGRTKCWTVPNRFLEGYKDCASCAVYKQCTGDEIGELNQAFNQMVSELRENLAKLEQANLEKSRLERLSLLGQMSAQVAHEIKNPLNAIKGSAHYLRSNFEGAIMDEFLQVIETESERLSDIVSDFLSFSKPGPPVMETARIQNVVQESVQLVRTEMADKGIVLHVRNDPDLLPFAFDQAKVKQALLNLLINAAEATPCNGEVTVSTEKVDSSLNIAVQDTGPGLTEDQVENLFKPFYTTKVRGSGLGLAIAEQNIRDHNGRIEVRNTPGQGAEFRIVLPV
jgi:signal transduction histidine kinase